MERYSVKKEYVLREIAGEYLAVPTEGGGEIVILNPVSRLLWEAMEKAPQTVDDLTALVCNDFEIDPATARNDIIEFLDNLKKNNLI